MSVASLRERHKIRRQVQLPFRKAVEISVKSVRIRFWRSVITAAGIFLGIAFFTSVRTSAVMAGLRQEALAEKREAIRIGRILPTPELTRELAASATDARDERSASLRLTWLSYISLLVCAVGITNAMLMSVTERFKEIGTMKCLGALDSLIVKLFFIESFLLGFIASVAGFVAGWLVIALLHIGDPFASFGGRFWVASGALMATAVGAGTLITLVATILPASRAAKMPAAAALRTEV